MRAGGGKRVVVFINIGDAFGRWTVRSFAGRTGAHYSWNCQCGCGDVVKVLATSLRRGISRQCRKCADAERRTHGMHATPTYKAWGNMHSRCAAVTGDHWNMYGARGIKVCKRWRKFENFLEDMGERPDGKSLERINNDHGYSKSNCKWATRSDQANNTRRNRRIRHQGETHTIAQWAAIWNVPWRTACRTLGVYVT